MRDRSAGSWDSWQRILWRMLMRALVRRGPRSAADERKRTVSQNIVDALLHFK